MASLTHFVVVGAGAAGLMTARELARAGKRVTLLLGSLLLAAVIFAIAAGAGMVFYLHTAR